MIKLLLINNSVRKCVSRTRGKWQHLFFVSYFHTYSIFLKKVQDQGERLKSFRSLPKHGVKKHFDSRLHRPACLCCRQNCNYFFQRLKQHRSSCPCSVECLKIMVGSEVRIEGWEKVELFLTWNQSSVEYKTFRWNS